MKVQRVDRIEVRDFKRIKEISIDLNEITILVGGNTCGKSSILQAAQLYTSIIQSSFKTVKPNNEKAIYDKTLSPNEIYYKPTENLLELRHIEPATQTKSIQISTTCTITTPNEEPQTASLKLNITRGKNANLSLDYEGEVDRLMPLIGERSKPFSILTPGLSGIPLREEWRTRGSLDAAAMHGDSNLYLRTLLDHLFTKGLTPTEINKWNSGDLAFDDIASQSSPWKLFSKLLEECYQGAKVYVTHEPEIDRYINVEVQYKGQKIPLDLAATGILQVIQILAYACFYSPPLILLDEPDAHLHADSQAKLLRALRAITEETDTRIILATHSPQIIQLSMDDPKSSIVWLQDGEKIELNSDRKPAIPVLTELGALSIASEIFNEARKIILLTEDSDATFIKALARANGAEEVACISYQSCGKLAGARELAKIISGIRPDARIIIHRDRDFRTHEEMEFERIVFEKTLERDGFQDSEIMEIFTTLNDVEHSFIAQEHITKAFNITPEDYIAVLEQAARASRDDIIDKARKTRETIEARLYNDRMKAKTDWRNEAGINEKPPGIKDFIPKNGEHNLTFDQCHGKTLYRSFKAKLHGKIGGNTKSIDESIKEPTDGLISEQWKTAFSYPNKV